jgi:hypothetical protein
MTPCVCLLSSPRRAFRIYGTLSSLLSFRTVFSVATATASPLKEDFQTDTLCATCSCHQHLFQLTIIDLVWSFVFAHKLTPVISVAKSFSVVTATVLQTLLIDRYGPILLGDNAVVPATSRFSRRAVAASRDALLCFTCTQRTCRIYDKLYPLLGSMSRSFSLSHPFAICGASICSPSTPVSLTL